MRGPERRETHPPGGAEGMQECVIYKQGVTPPGKTTVTLQRDGVTLVVVNVPAEV